MRRYPTVFDEACKAARITLDTNSPHPKYGIRNGFFKVEINESTRVAKISDLEGKLAELPADVEAIVVEKIRIEYLGCLAEDFTAPTFSRKSERNTRRLSRENI